MLPLQMYTRLVVVISKFVDGCTCFVGKLNV